MYKSEMHCQLLVIVVNESVWEDHEFDHLEPLCVIAPDIDLPNLPQPANQPYPPQQQQPETAQQSQTAQQPKTAHQPDPPKQPEPVDIFDNEEEYVGVNDEHMYIPIPPTQPSMNAQTDSSMPTNDETENATAEGAIPPEAEVDDVDPEEIRVLHDPENPIIEVGALFPDIITFRKAIRHYVVETGFEFSPGLKTEPYQIHCKV
jgi:hypothetical protein